MELIILIGVLVIITTYSAFSWGFVFYKFYYWFLLTVFTTLPHINYYEAVGLMLFVGLFKNHFSKENKEDEVNWGLFLCYPWISLILGWFILNLI